MDTLAIRFFGLYMELIIFSNWSERKWFIQKYISVASGLDSRLYKFICHIHSYNMTCTEQVTVKCRVVNSVNVQNKGKARQV